MDTFRKRKWEWKTELYTCFKKNWYDHSTAEGKKNLKGLSGIHQKPKPKHLSSRVFLSYKIITSVNVSRIQPEKGILFIKTILDKALISVLNDISSQIIALLKKNAQKLDQGKK